MIEIEYVVRDHKGAERLRTTDKKAADAYDKVLESAERLSEFIRRDGLLSGLPETDLEELTIFLVRNAKSVELILKGKIPDTPDSQEERNATDGIVTPLRAAN